MWLKIDNPSPPFSSPCPHILLYSSSRRAKWKPPRFTRSSSHLYPCFFSRTHHPSSSCPPTELQVINQPHHWMERGIRMIVVHHLLFWTSRDTLKDREPPNFSLPVFFLSPNMAHSPPLTLLWTILPCRGATKWCLDGITNHPTNQPTVGLKWRQLETPREWDLHVVSLIDTNNPTNSVWYIGSINSLESGCEDHNQVEWAHWEKSCGFDKTSVPLDYWRGEWFWVVSDGLCCGTREANWFNSRLDSMPALQCSLFEAFCGYKIAVKILRHPLMNWKSPHKKRHCPIFWPIQAVYRRCSTNRCHTWLRISDSQIMDTWLSHRPISPLVNPNDWLRGLVKLVSLEKQKTILYFNWRLDKYVCLIVSKKARTGVK